nr:hypothetical protein [Desulfoplanes formicivorans]
MRALRIPVWLFLLVLTFFQPKAWAEPALTILYTANSWGHYRPIKA